MIQTNDGQCLCSCSDGFILHTDQKTCLSGNLIKDNFFLVADDYRYQIYQTDADFRDISAVRFPPQDRPISLDYDFKEERIYWTDFETSIMKRSFLNGSNIETIHLKLPGSQINGIAISSESRLLYFADSQKNEIGFMTLDGRYSKILLRRNLTNPRAIVLDEVNGFMYYTSRNSSHNGGHIDRCSMDGSNCVTLIRSDSSWPTGLVIDFEEKQMYWCDSHTEKVEAAQLDGSGRRTVYKGSLNEDPFGIALIGSYVYWTDWNTKGISRIRKDGTGFERIHQDFFRGPNDIKFFNKTALHVVNRCSEKNGGCSHFCIPTPNQGRICACPDVDRHNSKSDKLDCSEIAVCPNFIANGHFHQQCSFTVGSSCQFTCNPGYGAATKVLIICQHDLQWSMDTSKLCLDETCPLLTNTGNAIIDIDCPQVAAVGVSCSQHCLDGYMWTDGDRVRTCSEDLSWTGQPIVCTAFTCSQLLTPANAKVSSAHECLKSSVSPGTRCHHQCLTGFIQSEGDQTRICEKNVGWSGTSIVCVPVVHGYCPAVSRHHGVQVEPDSCTTSNQPVGSICRQYCQPGFLMVTGNYSQTCIGNHMWSGSPITCINQTVVEIGQSDERHEVGLIVGLTIGMLLISILVVVAVVAICRYCVPKKFHENCHYFSDFRFHHMDEDLQPVVLPRAFNTPVYYTKPNKANPDGMVSFDNPAYANVGSLNINRHFSESREILEQGLASAAGSWVSLKANDEAASAQASPSVDQVVFANPLYSQPMTIESDGAQSVA